MSWTKRQAKLVARRIKDSHGSAWRMLVDEVREALLDAAIIDVVFGLREVVVEIDAIRNLRSDVADAMMVYGLRTPTGDR